MVLTVVAPFPLPSYGNLPTEPLIAAYEKATVENTTRILAEAKACADRLGVACEAQHVKNEDAAEGILDTAKRASCDLIVMGSHGYRGIKRHLLGSVATKVITVSVLPVLVCR